MGLYFSKNTVKIRIVDNVKKRPKYDYLRPNGDIVLCIDKVYKFPCLNLISTNGTQTV